MEEGAGDASRGRGGRRGARGKSRGRGGNANAAPATEVPIEIEGNVPPNQSSRGRGRGKPSRGRGIVTIGTEGNGSSSAPSRGNSSSSSSSSSSNRPSRGGAGGGGGRRGRGGYRGDRGGRGRGDTAAAAARTDEETTGEAIPFSSSSSPREHVEGASCVICTEPLDNKRHRPGVGSCQHIGTCALCFMRLRLLLKNNTCSLCKCPLEHVYIFDSPSAIVPYNSLNIWGTEAGPGMVYDDRSQIFMPRTFHKEVFLPIQALRCGTSNCEFLGKSSGALRAHLREKHDSHLCEICLEHKKVFLGEQIRYTKAQLTHHIEKGDPSHGFSGHPPCKFCRGKPFYDSNQLFDHLRKDHYTCDLCERRGVLHRYYRDYKDLESHFRQEHYLCENSNCLEARFVVFAEALDLHAHILATHPEQGASRRLDLDVTAFRVRGQQGLVEDDEEGTREWTPQPPPPPQSEALHGRAGYPTEATRGVATQQSGVPQQPSQDFPELSAEATRAGLARAPGMGVPISSARRGASFVNSAFPPLPAPTPTPTGPPSRPQPLPPARPLIPPSARPSASAWALPKSAAQALATPAPAPRDEKQEQVLNRNLRFAEALGIKTKIQGQAEHLATSRGGKPVDGLDAFEIDLERPVYPKELLSWATVNKLDVIRLEKKIADFLSNPSEASLYLKPMPRDERRHIHMLAEFYGLKTISYDPEPKRFVSLIKVTNPKSRVPVILLSEAAAEAITNERLYGSRGGGPVGRGALIGGVGGPGRGQAAKQTDSVTLIISQISPEISGKVVTDRLKSLIPDLPLISYYFQERDPNDLQILMVELGSEEAMIALIEKARMRPEVLNPFRLRPAHPITVPPPPPPPYPSSYDYPYQGRQSIFNRPPAPPSTTSSSAAPVESEGGGGGSGEGGGRWGHSALKGKLAPRTKPIEHPVVVKEPSSSSAAEPKVKITKLGGKARGGGRKSLNEEIEARPGQGIVSNRWAGLLDEDEEEEEEGEDQGEEEQMDAQDGNGGEGGGYGDQDYPLRQEEEEYVGGDAW